MQADQPQLVVDDPAVGLVEAGLRFAQGLHLAAPQHEAALQLLEDLEVAPGQSVGGEHPVEWDRAASSGKNSVVGVRTPTAGEPSGRPAGGAPAARRLGSVGPVLRLDRATYLQIVAHAYDELPYEMCGLLAGRRE